MFPEQNFSSSFELNPHENIWELPWGETRKIKDHFNEAEITFKNHKNIKMGNILFRVYDDGIAFRYQLDKTIGNDDSLVISDEITEFKLVEDAQSWWTPAYTENRYEHLYRNTKVSQMDTVHTPFTVRYSDSTHLSFHEADLKDYSSMQIFSKNNVLNCDLAPWPNGDKVRMIGIDAPELKDNEGLESKNHLKLLIENKYVSLIKSVFGFNYNK